MPFQYGYTDDNGFWHDEDPSSQKSTHVVPYGYNGQVLDPSNIPYDAETGEQQIAYWAPPLASNGSYLLGTDKNYDPSRMNQAYQGAQWIDGVGWVVPQQNYHQTVQQINNQARAALEQHNHEGIHALNLELTGPAIVGALGAGAIAGAGGAAGGAAGNSLGGSLASQSALDAYLAGSGAAGGAFDPAGGAVEGGGYQGYGGGEGGTGITDYGRGADFNEFVNDYGVNPGGLQSFGGSNALTDLLTKMSPNALSTLLGSGIQGISSLLASKAQTAAGNQANNTLLGMYNQSRADLAPYREAGYGALDKLTALTTPGNQFTMMQADPGYQFRLDQGTRALDNRLKAGGKFYSGAALRGGQDYTQGFASNEFNNVYNRLAGLAGTGQTATNTTAGLGSQTAQNVANNETGMGNARASGYVGLGNAVQGGINSYNNQNFTNALLAMLSKQGGF